MRKSECGSGKLRHCGLWSVEWMGSTSFIVCRKRGNFGDIVDAILHGWGFGVFFWRRGLLLNGACWLCAALSLAPKRNQLKRQWFVYLVVKDRQC